MTREERIIYAVIAIKRMAALYENLSSKRIDARSEMALKKLHEAENDLYDAIGGMEKYKYDMEA